MGALLVESGKGRGPFGLAKPEQWHVAFGEVEPPQDLLDDRHTVKHAREHSPAAALQLQHHTSSGWLGWASPCTGTGMAAHH